MTTPDPVTLMVGARSRSVDGVFREGGDTDDAPQTAREGERAS